MWEVLAAAAQPLAPFLPSREEFERLVSAVRSPWVDAANALPSFESLAEIASLGNAISSAPYDAISSAALRTALGDWSHIQLNETIISNWQTRQRFYFDHGFDSRLTILPEPAFTDSLYETHILLPDLFLSLPTLKERRAREQPLDDKDAVKQRMLDAFDILFNLETKLRIFIHEIMTERFGQSWYKQRVPGELRKDWQEKRKIALSKKEREYPLLWYADFTDYIKIIEQNHNWNDVFASVFQNKMDIQTSFQRLFPIRICIAHQRPIIKEDFLLLTVESHRILRAIGELPASENPLC